MRRLYSKNQLVKLIEEHTEESAVKSVNGETGDVELDATDIYLTTTGTDVQTNIQRIDSELGDISRRHTHRVKVEIMIEDEDSASGEQKLDGVFTFTSEGSTAIEDLDDLKDAICTSDSVVLFSGTIDRDDTRGYNCFVDEETFAPPYDTIKMNARLCTQTDSDENITLISPLQFPSFIIDEDTYVLASDIQDRVD